MTIEIALGFIDPFFGSCRAYAKLDQSVINTLVNGSIIQWNSLFSAYKERENKNLSVYSQIPFHENHCNVVFKIYSQTGRSIKPFVDQAKSEKTKYLNTIAIYDEIVFPPGAQFMVCKKEKAEGSLKMIIYLREIVTGHQENVVMWVDDQIFNALDPEISS